MIERIEHLTHETAAEILSAAAFAHSALELVNREGIRQKVRDVVEAETPTAEGARAARESIEDAFPELATEPVARVPRVAEILQADASLYARKAADYAPGANPFENFETAARIASRMGGKDLTREDVCRVLIGVKLSRLETLGLRPAANEGVIDTIRDLRVYLAILEAMIEERAAREAGA